MEKPNELSDEQIETEIKTLQDKKDASQEEKEKFQQLKEERSTRYQKKIDKLHWEKKTEKERAEKLESELKAQREELEKIKAERQQQAKPIIVEEYVEYGGKKYYTDKALMSMVESKELDPQQAYAHQQQRLKAEIKNEIEMESKAKDMQGQFQKTFEQDKEEILREHPEFHPSHPKHDPNDPLFKLATEICNEDFIVNGQFVNPRALSLSVKRAKQILKTTDTRPDVSDHQTVGRPGTSIGTVKDQVTLSPLEQEAAVRMYGSVVNPATNKPYTEQEAINKALKAKKARGR